MGLNEIICDRTKRNNLQGSVVVFGAYAHWTDDYEEYMKDPDVLNYCKRKPMMTSFVVLLIFRCPANTLDNCFSISLTTNIGAPDKLQSIIQPCGFLAAVTWLCERPIMCVAK